MNKTVRLLSPREVVVVDEEQEPLEAGEVRVKTLFSGISSGTELSLYRGTNPFLGKDWDPQTRLLSPMAVSTERPIGQTASHQTAARQAVAGLRAGRVTYPVDGTGYEEVGRVVEVGEGVNGVSVGQLVWGTWGHRGSVVRSGEYASERILDSKAAPVIGVFSQIGAIALNVVLDADIHLGETVVVFGVGVLGQIVAQLARLNGARVVVVDAIDTRLDLAKRLGASEVIDPKQGNVAERIRELTDDRGADVCLEATGSYAALHEAIRSAAYSARVVSAGFFQGEGSALALGEEFHHNRVQVVCSQIFGVAPALTYRWDAYRLQRTFMELATSNRVQVEPLVSEVIPVEEAARAFELVDKKPQDVLEVVLSFEEPVL
jgi:threonine dehydrogenase-like Zn-dependent dehydrogenase